jgi:membrane-associated phospholipid phosphatase
MAAFIITSKWKISAHMIGIGGITGLIAYLIYYLHVNLEIYLIVIVLVSGLTGTARLILNAHHPSEIYSGFLMGFAIISVVMFVY